MSEILQASQSYYFSNSNVRLAKNNLPKNKFSKQALSKNAIVGQTYPKKCLALPILKELEDIIFVTEFDGYCHLQYSGALKFSHRSSSWQAPEYSESVFDYIPDIYHALLTEKLDCLRKSGLIQKFIICLQEEISASGLWLQCQISHLREEEAGCNIGDDAVLWVVRDVTDIKQTEILLQQAAMTDVLTGLGNRRSYETKVQREVIKARKYEMPLTLALIDVDFFKMVNDTHGHVAGDEVLCHLTRLVSDFLESDDCFFRFGGEEFMILFPGIPEPDVHKMMDELRNRVSEKAYVFEDGTSVKLTISVGIAELDKFEKTYLEMQRRADTALYCAKHGGRNKCMVAQKRMNN